MSWFDILKRNPMEEALRMRERMGTAKPQSQPSGNEPTKQQCDVCGRMKLNVKQRADGSNICSVCEAIQRKKDTEAIG